MTKFNTCRTCRETDPCTKERHNSINGIQQKLIHHDERSSLLSSPPGGSPSRGGLRHAVMNPNTTVQTEPATLSGLQVPPLPPPVDPYRSTLFPLLPLRLRSSMVMGMDRHASALRDDVPRTVSTTDAMGITDIDLTSSKTWPPFGKNK